MDNETHAWLSTWFQAFQVELNGLEILMAKTNENLNRIAVAMEEANHLAEEEKNEWSAILKYLLGEGKQ